MGSSVGHIRAHDLDTGDNAMLEYAIVPGDEGNMFDIISNGQDGVVVLKKVQYKTSLTLVENCRSTVVSHVDWKWYIVQVGVRLIRIFR